jgi:hypothetical protein
MDGSPGQEDPTPPETPAVVINEALTRTLPPAKDAIELYNPTVAVAKIGGWFLTDDRSEPRKFRVPEGSGVPGGGYLVFDEDDFNADPDSPNSFLLSSLGEEVYLFSADSEGNLTSYSHGYQFGAAEDGVTFGRYVISTGDDHFVPQVSETLSGGNAGPKVGPVVINEIMFNPLPIKGRNNTDHEYLELRNVSSESVPLFDPDTPESTWRVGGGIDYAFPPNTTLAAGDYILVVCFDPGIETTRLDDFRSTYGLDVTVKIFGPFTGRLENLGERISLFKPDHPMEPPHPDAGTVPYLLMDRVDYSNSDPWPTGADGTGKSLQRVVGGEYGNDPINWGIASPTPGQDNAGVGPQDADGDGMPDQWEIDYFSGTDVPNGGPAEDWDGDGSSNLDEYLAGTDPTDAASVLAISSILTSSDSTFTIRWRSVGGKYYSILKTTDLAAGFDQIESTNIPATPPENFCNIDGSQTDRAFYKVVVDE